MDVSTSPAEVFNEATVVLGDILACFASLIQGFITNMRSIRRHFRRCCLMVCYVLHLVWIALRSIMRDALATLVRSTPSPESEESDGRSNHIPPKCPLLRPLARAKAAPRTGLTFSESAALHL